MRVDANVGLGLGDGHGEHAGGVVGDDPGKAEKQASDGQRWTAIQKTGILLLSPFSTVHRWLIIRFLPVMAFSHPVQGQVWGWDAPPSRRMPIKQQF
jgi:hypothetical protein